MAYIISGLGAVGSQVEPRTTKAAVIPDAGQRLAPPTTQLLDAGGDEVRLHRSQFLLHNYNPQ